MATGGLYAPTIRHWKGTTYIVCTNVVHEGDPPSIHFENFIISTPDIWSDSWSDPTPFDFYGIDPSLFFDDDGRVYIQGSAWAPVPGIAGFEIDLATGRKLSPEEILWKGFSEHTPEAPHVYRKDGWYYLLIAEGGTGEGHHITVARSTSIRGPYMAYEDNPILPPAKPDRHIQHTGHGDLVMCERGNWWVVCLGVRKSQGSYILGRESFLSPVEWPKDGWPTICEIGTYQTPPGNNSETEPSAAGSGLLPPLKPLVDLVGLRDSGLAAVHVSSDGRDMVLTSQEGDISDVHNSVAFVGKRQRSLDGEATVSLRRPSVQGQCNLKAGLAYYKDEHRFIRIFLETSDQGAVVVFEVFNRANSEFRRAQFQAANAQSVSFRVSYDPRSLKFDFKLDDSVWTRAGVVDSAVMSGYDFVGPIIGVFAISPNDVLAEFQGFSVA